MTTPTTKELDSHPSPEDRSRRGNRLALVGAGGAALLSTVLLARLLTGPDAESPGSRESVQVHHVAETSPVASRHDRTLAVLSAVNAEGGYQRAAEKIADNVSDPTAKEKIDGLLDVRQAAQALDEHGNFDAQRAAAILPYVENDRLKHTLQKGIAVWLQLEITKVEAMKTRDAADVAQAISLSSELSRITGELKLYGGLAEALTKDFATPDS